MSGTSDDVVGMKFEVTDLREDAFGSDEAGRKGNVVMFGPRESQKYIHDVQTGTKVMKVVRMNFQASDEAGEGDRCHGCSKGPEVHPQFADGQQDHDDGEMWCVRYQTPFLDGDLCRQQDRQVGPPVLEVDEEDVNKEFCQ